jgi:EmrB/QacA subfamily drug resistance transporter
MTSRSRWLAFAAVCSMQLMMVLDVSIVTVALRSIQQDLGFEQARVAWVTTAYTIGFGGLLLLSGRLGDLLGRKRMFLSGLTVFLVSSVLCGLSRSQDMLLASRFLQGAGSAMSYAVVMGIVFTLFQDPHKVGKAMGALGFVQAAGASVGIVAGGALVQGINWHWVFFVNIPIGIAAAVLAVRLVPSDAGLGIREGADALGAVLVTAGMMLGVYMIATVGDYGWGSGHTLGYGFGSLGLLAAFIAREATAAKPIMKLSLFRSRNLSGANAVHLLLVAGMISANIVIALYLQQVVGYSPARAGFAFLPLALSAALSSLGLSARLNLRYGPRAVLLASLVIITAALVLATRVPVDAVYIRDVVPTLVLLGAGAGLAMPAVMTLAMAVRSPSDVGLASGLAGSSGMIGDSLGIAAITAIAATRARTLTGRGKSAAFALDSGYRLAFGVGAGVVAVAFVVGFFWLKAMSPMPQGGEPGPPMPEGGESRPQPESAEPGVGSAVV